MLRTFCSGTIVHLRHVCMQMFSTGTILQVVYGTCFMTVYGTTLQTL